MDFKRYLKILIPYAMILLLMTQVFAQKTAIQVDGQQIKDLIATMSTDAQMGRKPLTPEFAKLQVWAADKFKAWGLEPAGDNGTYFGAVPITGRRGTYAFTYGTPTMKVNGREFFTKYRDFSIDHRSVTHKVVKGGIVFVGYGISAPSKGLDEYAGVDVSGKFVFAYKGNPNDAKAERGFFGSGAKPIKATETWDIEAKDSTKILTAYEKGAAGIILYNPYPSPRSRFMFFREPVYASTFTRDFMIVSDVNERVYNWIFWTHPQESDRAFKRRMAEARLQIKQKKAQSFATQAKIEVRGFDNVDLYGEKFGNNTCRNVLAKITGTDPVLKNEYIVLGGHFDHLGVRNGQVYNGADDNASGSAVVMEVSRLMAQNNIRLKRTVIFGLWTGEELGLIGSTYWADHPTDGVTMDRVVTNFNMDMVAMGDKIGAPGALNFPSIWDVIKKDQNDNVISVVDASEGGPGGSDHSAFISRGIESMALMTRGGGGHPDYHDLGDDTEKAEPEILGKVGQFVLQATVNLGNAPESLIIPDRQYIFDGMRWNIAVVDPAIEAENSWKVLEAESRNELTAALIDKVAELKKPKENEPVMMFFRRGPRAPFQKGLAGPSVLDHDIDMLKVVSSVLEIGRMDVKGDDGTWFANGLTECGLKALKTMEDSDIVLHLSAPTSETLTAVLEAANKPFLISCANTLDDNQITLIQQKDVLVAVDFNPTDVNSCTAMLEDLKDRIGDRDNLVLNIRSAENLDKAKKALYRQLLDKGWAKEEIYALGGSGTRRGSLGNFVQFVTKK